jgi:DNA-directed RNA polymerase I subunit RPA2
VGGNQVNGFTVVADKLNFLRYLSHFRCVHRGAYFAQMKTTAVRKLLPEGWGTCPVQRQLGASSGILTPVRRQASCALCTRPTVPLAVS